MSSDLVGAGYDAVYRSVPRSERFSNLWRQHASGEDYPPEFAHISFLTTTETRAIADALELEGSSRFADLACGAGGPCLWIAQLTGAAAVGVDVSGVGVATARSRAMDLGLSDRASFAVGTFAGVPIRTAALDGVMSADAIQYAPSKHDLFREVARILRPGGRMAFVAFELDATRAAGLPVIGSDPVDDYRPHLDAAGFDVERYEGTDRWLERLTAAYQAVLAGDGALQDELGQEAYAALTMEMTLTLDVEPYSGRVIAVARRRA